MTFPHVCRGFGRLPHCGRFVSTENIMRTIVSCPCGATYERTETSQPLREAREFRCEVCGEILENWTGPWVPQFRLLEVREPESAGSIGS